MSEVLFLAHRAPMKPDRGDKIRSFHILRHLSERMPVHLVAFADTVADMNSPQGFSAGLASCTIVPRVKSRVRAVAEALATGRAVSVTAFADPAMRRAVDGVLASETVRSIYCFSGQMGQYLRYGGQRTVMDFVDVDSEKFKEMGETGTKPLRWLMRREARLLGRFERDVAARVDATVFVSEEEAGLFGEGAGKVHVVGNGVDTLFFDPAASFAAVDERGPLIVFTGQMDYRPNIDAVRHFTDAILPLVRERHPAVRFAIVGRAPGASVRALASKYVIVTGGVEDVRGWLQAATVCVAPLTIARGVQNKVLEAMAMARPVVASGAAAEGIDHGNTIMVTDGPAVFADAVTGLLDDPRRTALVGARARARVVERYAWSARLAPLGAMLGVADPADAR